MLTSLFQYILFISAFLASPRFLFFAVQVSEHVFALIMFELYVFMCLFLKLSIHISQVVSYDSWTCFPESLNSIKPQS